MYAKTVESERVMRAAEAAVPQPSQRSRKRTRVRGSARRLWLAATQPASLQQARDLVDVLQGLEEWDHGLDWRRPTPMVALNDHQVALLYSLVLLALVQKTECAVDRPGAPRYVDVLDRWLQASADELKEVQAPPAQVLAPRLEVFD